MESRRRNQQPTVADISMKGKQKNSRLQRFPLLLGWVFVVVGCSDSDFAVVTGVVTLDGKPLSGAGVNFKPDVGAIASAVTDENGKYRLKTGSINGALRGDHKVTISKWELVGRGGAPAEASEGPASQGGGLRPQWYTPQKYADIKTSGFAAIVTSGKNKFQFDLLSNQ